MRTSPTHSITSKWELVEIEHPFRKTRKIKSLHLHGNLDEADILAALDLIKTGKASALEAFHMPQGSLEFIHKAIEKDPQPFSNLLLMQAHISSRSPYFTFKQLLYRLKHLKHFPNLAQAALTSSHLKGRISHDLRKAGPQLIQCKDAETSLEKELKAAPKRRREETPTDPETIKRRKEKEDYLKELEQDLMIAPTPVKLASPVAAPARMFQPFPTFKEDESKAPCSPATSPANPV